MAMRDYSINTARQVCRLLPYYLRGRKMILFLQAVSSPLSFFNTGDTAFNPWAHRKLLELSMNGQKIRLEWWLNNIFVSDYGITLRPGQLITIREEEVGNAIVYSRREIRNHDSAPLFYPHYIPTVTRLRENVADAAKKNTVTRYRNEAGGQGAWFVITIPYAGEDHQDIIRKVGLSISKFVPVGTMYKVEFT